jgi:dihydropyrimidinase
MVVDCIVRGGTVVTATDMVEASIAICGEKIVAVGPEEALPPAKRAIDATGKVVLPGAIDSHIHLVPEGEDWQRGSIAAAHAGLTTVLGFVLSDAASRETLPLTLGRLRAETERTSVLDFGFHLILPPWPYLLAGLPEALKMGVTSFKMFMTYKKRGRQCPDDFILQVMELVAAHGAFVQLHCENGEVIDYLENKALAAGRVSPQDFPPTCPDWVEAEAIHRGALLAAFAGCPLYVVHLSSQCGLEEIKHIQARGQRVWTETCPQYLTLSDAEMERWGPLAKIGPPLRPAEGPDREALWQGLAQGHIAVVASDHAPRPPSVKEPGWKNIFVDPSGAPIPFGTASVETMVPLMWSEGVAKRGLPPTWMARVLAENPARIFGLYPRKGTIRPGADADLLLIDPDVEWTIRAADHHGIAGSTCWEGWQGRGRPWMTLLRGRVLLDQGRLWQTPGYGRFLPRTGWAPPLAGALG